MIQSLLKAFPEDKKKKQSLENKKKDIYAALKKIFPDTITGSLITTTMSIRYPDIVIPSKHVVIEYDFEKITCVDSHMERDTELIDLGFFLIHYVGYIPLMFELAEDLVTVLSGECDVVYKEQ